MTKEVIPEHLEGLTSASAQYTRHLRKEGVGHLTGAPPSVSDDFDPMLTRLLTHDSEFANVTAQLPVPLSELPLEAQQVEIEKLKAAIRRARQRRTHRLNGDAK